MFIQAGDRLYPTCTTTCPAHAEAVWDISGVCRFWGAGINLTEGKLLFSTCLLTTHRDCASQVTGEKKTSVWSVGENGRLAEFWIL